jgi:hypothetical protein
LRSLVRLAFKLLRGWQHKLIQSANHLRKLIELPPKTESVPMKSVRSIYLLRSLEVLLRKTRGCYVLLRGRVLMETHVSCRIAQAVSV